MQQPDEGTFIALVMKLAQNQPSTDFMTLDLRALVQMIVADIPEAEQAPAAFAMGFLVGRDYQTGRELDEQFS